MEFCRRNFTTCIKKSEFTSRELFFTYLIWYSVGRFFVEGLRTDSLMLGPLRIAQVMSIGLVVISIIFIIVRRKMGQADKRYLEN